MLDLSAVTAVLAGLGPWGLLAGVVLTLGVQWAKKKFPHLVPGKPSPVPEPGPAPAPNPSDPIPAAPTGRPLLDLALRILAGIAARRFPKLTQSEAMERYLVEEAGTQYRMEEYKAEDAAAELKTRG
jgi:hypothetical protein